MSSGTLAAMRWPACLLGLLVACGAPPEERSSEAPPTAVAPAPPHVPLPVQTIVSTPRLLVEVPLGLVDREGTIGLVFRVTNRSEASLLADLRSVDRVIGVGPAAPHMPLTEAQRGELSLVSALTSLTPGETITYAVPAGALDPSCDGERHLSVSGVLVVLDGDRVAELIADGTEVAIPCAAPIEARAPGTIWVADRVPMLAEDRALETFADELAPLVRAASVDPETEIALLAFSYDARPIERFRYDACVALGRCPARSVPQPSGSLHTPAVGMSWEAADAFCVTRGLHVASEPERLVIRDASRALVPGDPSTLVRSGFACVRPEPS
jgi:hypothetical protein